jgi:hypothetical protein
VLSQALGGTVFGKNKLVFGIFTTGCPQVFPLTLQRPQLPVKILRVKKGAVSVAPENPNYRRIEITSEMDFRTLGVVTYVVR